MATSLVPSEARAVTASKAMATARATTATLARSAVSRARAGRPILALAMASVPSRAESALAAHRPSRVSGRHATAVAAATCGLPLGVRSGVQQPTHPASFHARDTARASADCALRARQATAVKCARSSASIAPHPARRVSTAWRVSSRALGAGYAVAAVFAARARKVPEGAHAKPGRGVLTAVATVPVGNPTPAADTVCAPPWARATATAGGPPSTAAGRATEERRVRAVSGDCAT